MKFGSVYQRIISKTANYTVVAGDDVVNVNAASGAVTITLYDPQGKYPEAGRDEGLVSIIKTDSSPNPVTIATAAGSLVGQVVLRQQYQSVTFRSDGIATWYSFDPIQNSFEAVVSLTAANLIAMNGAPVTLIPAPGAGKVVIVEDILFKMTRTATAFTNGGALEFRYTNGSGAKVSADIASSVVTTGGAGLELNRVGHVVTSLTPVANAPIVITNATAAFATGTGTAQVIIKFRVLDAA